MANYFIEIALNPQLYLTLNNPPTTFHQSHHKDIYFSNTIYYTDKLAQK